MTKVIPCYPDCLYRIWYEGNEKCDSCTRKDSKPCTRPRNTSPYINDFYGNVEESCGWEPEK